MAIAARIDDIIFHPNGNVEVKITEGETPLPAQPSNNATIYADKNALLDAVADLEDELAQGKLALIQLAAGIKKDPQMGQNFVNQTEGKTCTLDLLGASVPIVVG
jgi:hypothetical protein